MTVETIPQSNMAAVQAALSLPHGNPQRAIAEQCLEIAALLLAKNASYGNAALNPIRVFAKNIEPVAQINVRIDDKLSRIARGHDYGEEDVELDLLGYLVLRRIARNPAARTEMQR